MCLIPNSKEFFIATAGESEHHRCAYICVPRLPRPGLCLCAGHEEWGKAHSVWGQASKSGYASPNGIILTIAVLQIADDESWAVIDKVPFEPFTSRTDSGNITTRCEPRSNRGAFSWDG